jgi:hypothetical protein
VLEPGAGTALATRGPLERGGVATDRGPRVLGRLRANLPQVPARGRPRGRLAGGVVERRRC